ncbi:MAG TPA: hypothetical protein IGR64_05385, partial [Leptolyngbyaceae cyanobacterium M65_K2018_010]|nr:hypothetical protein [Leptolyngbyaceae cyanobacterium M65_K2018_010]
MSTHTLRPKSRTTPQPLKRSTNLLKYVQDVGQVTAAALLGTTMIASAVVAGGL